MIQRILALATLILSPALISTAYANQTSAAPSAEVLIQHDDSSGSDSTPYSAYFKHRNGKTARVSFDKVDGFGVTEGDILLGRIQSFRQDGMIGFVSKSLGVNTLGQLWDQGILRYQISPELDATMTQRIEAAFAHWKDNTELRAEQLPYDPNQSGDYVEFVNAAGCASYVGRIGGRQEVWVNSSCTTGNIIHEIGHAYGLYHEHTRPDRDNYITVNTPNIQNGKSFNFEIQHFGSEMLGAYDYNSIMHYGSYFFATDRSQPTIIAPQAIGQRVGLSAGDISGIHQLYNVGLQLDMSVADTLIQPNSLFDLHVKVHNKSHDTVSNLRFELPLDKLQLDTTRLAQDNNGYFNLDSQRWDCQSSSLGVSCSQITPIASGEQSSLVLTLQSPPAAQIDPRWPLEELSSILYTSDGQSKTQAKSLVINTQNFAPRVKSGLSFSVYPQAEQGTLVGIIDAEDWNRDTIKLSLGGGNLGGMFALDSNTGELTVNNPLALPADGSILTLTIVADDGELYSDPVDVTIRIDSSAINTSAAAGTSSGGTGGSLALLNLLAMLGLCLSKRRRACQ